MPKEENAASSRTRCRRTRSFLPSTPYVRSLLRLYLALPHTPNRASHDDCFLAYQLQLKKVPLFRAQAALMLGSARRASRPNDAELLPPIRSLRYFLPVLEELRFASVGQDYLEYLRGKLSDLLGSKLPLPSAHQGDSPPSRKRRPRLPEQLPLPW